MQATPPAEALIVVGDLLRSRLHGEEPPRLGHAAEVVAATICEAQAGARHQIFDRGRHDHLAGTGGGRISSTNTTPSSVESWSGTVDGW